MMNISSSKQFIVECELCGFFDGISEELMNSEGYENPEEYFKAHHWKYLEEDDLTVCPCCAGFINVVTDFDKVKEAVKK